MGASRHGMTDIELVAVWHYTGPGYAPLNAALRSGDPARLARVDNCRRTLDNALARLPPDRGPKRRAVDLTDAQRARYVRARRSSSPGSPPPLTRSITTRVL